jgi:hypothetical protein
MASRASRTLLYILSARGLSLNCLRVVWFPNSFRTAGGFRSMASTWRFAHHDAGEEALMSFAFPISSPADSLLIRIPIPATTMTGMAATGVGCGDFPRHRVEYLERSQRSREPFASGCAGGGDLHGIRAYLAQRQGVTAVHNLHIWAISTTEIALTCHRNPRALPGYE